MKRKIILALVASCAAALATWFSATDRSRADRANIETSGRPEGFRVYVDPATRTLVDEPSDVPGLEQLPKDLQDALNTSGEGLVEEPSPVDGGGVMIDLQGRFQNTTMATKDIEAEIAAPCLPVRPESIERTLEKAGDEAGSGDER